MDALTPTTTSIVPPKPNTTTISRRSNTLELDEINAIFDDIQRLADGSAPLPISDSSSTDLARRSIASKQLEDFISYIERLLSNSGLAKRSAFSDDNDGDNLATAIAKIHGWADGTIALPGEDGDVVVGDFTTDDAIEFANLLKDVIIAWRTQYDAFTTSEPVTDIVARSPIALDLELSAPHFSSLALDKRNTLVIKIALKAIAAAIDAFADTL